MPSNDLIINWSENNYVFTWISSEKILILAAPSTDLSELHYLSVDLDGEEITWTKALAVLLREYSSQSTPWIQDILSDGNCIGYGIEGIEDGTRINKGFKSVTGNTNAPTTNLVSPLTTTGATSTQGPTAEIGATALPFTDFFGAEEQSTDWIPGFPEVDPIHGPIVPFIIQPSFTGPIINQPRFTGIITHGTSTGTKNTHTIGKNTIFNLPDKESFGKPIYSDLEQVGKEGIVSTTVPADAKLNYIPPVDPENTGTMYIGDILFTIPPTNMRFSFINEAMSIPTMRTKGDPITSTNNSIPKVTLTLYFSGKDQINNQLRPLIALYQNMPFTSVQNTTIYDSWVGRRDTSDENKDLDRFIPVPCYLENVNFSTVPGFPNTIQAHLNLVMMETSPFSPGLRYWKRTTDALDQAVKKGTRQSMGNTIISSSDKKETKNNSIQNTSTLKVLTSTGKVITITIDDDPKDENKTIYPQESIPFGKMYRNRLIEEKNSYSRITKNPVLHWNTYKEEDNSSLYLSYRSPKTFDTHRTKFLDRYKKLTSRVDDMKLLFSVTGLGLTDETSVAELFKNEKDFGVKDALQSMFEHLSIIKTFEEAQRIIEEAWLNALELTSTQLSHFYTDFKISVRIGDDETREMSIQEIMDSSDVEIEYIKDGKISRPVEDILKALNKLIKEDIENRTEDSDPDSLKFIDIIINNLIQNPLINNDSPSNPENYRTIEVKLGWSEDPSTGNAEKLVTKGKFPGDPDDIKLLGDKVRYEFQSVIQSISYSYGNSFSPKFVLASKKPSYQHMGISNAIATISLRTRDERLLKVLSDIREAAHTAGREIMSGNFSILGFDAIAITGKTDSAYSGNLLNCFGFKDCNITNIDSRSIEGFPGWWEISIDLVENNTYLRSWETFSEVPSLGNLELNKLRKNTFPSIKIHNLKAEPTHLDISVEEAALETLMDEVIRKTMEFAVYFKSGSGGDRRKTPVTYLGDEEMGTTFVKMIPKNLDKFKKTTYVKVQWTKDGFKISQTQDSTINYSAGFATWLTELTNEVRMYEEYDEFLRVNDDTYAEYEQEYGNLPNKIIRFSLSAAIIENYLDIIKRTIFITDSIIPELIINKEVRYPLQKNRNRNAWRGEAHLISDGSTYTEQVTAVTEIFKYGDSRKQWKRLTNFPYTETVVPQMYETGGFRKELGKTIFIDPTDTDFVLDTDTFRLQSIVLQNYVQERFLHIFRRQDYRDLVDLNKEHFEIDDSVDLGIIFSELNKSVKQNYPDLNLPDIYIKSTGTQLMSPSFCFVDSDDDLEIIEMEKSLNVQKQVISSQIAALWGTIHYGGCSDRTKRSEKDCIEADATWDNTGYAGIRSRFVDSDNNNTEIFNTALTTLANASEDNGVKVTIPNSLVGVPGATATINSTDPRDIKAYNMFVGFEDMVTRIEAEQLTLDKVNTPVSTILDKGYQGLDKSSIMNLMSLTSLLDYVISIMAISPYVSSTEKLDEFRKLFETGSDESFKALTNAMADEVRKIIKDDGSTENTKALSDMLRDALVMGGTDQLNVVNESHAEKLAEIVFNKRSKAISMLTISSTGDYRAFNQYFGIGDIEGDFKQGELLRKFNNYLQYKRRGSMDRAFPTFKLFFMVENSPAWVSFDDFYTYDAVSEISVVESKHAASKTALIKLSNVTSKLTGKPYNDLINQGQDPLPGGALNLKVGAELMILMGYGADYRQLRMKFKGAVTEIRPGVVLELTAQSWGAGLLNNVGKVDGVKHTALQGAATLGSVVLDILAQTPGLGKLGRWSFRDPELNDPNKISETTLRRVYWARAINSALGWTDFLPGKTNIGDIIGGYFDNSDESSPSTGEAYMKKIRENDAIISSFGNALFDNIIINNSKPKGYGFWNMFKRGIDSKTWGFQWYIFNQSAWDALHEVALFMGDYIITTLPYNEGQDVFGSPPRETLYFGPREHFYKSSDYRPSLDVKSVYSQLIEEYKTNKALIDNYDEYFTTNEDALKDAQDKLKELNTGVPNFEEVSEDLILHGNVNGPTFYSEYVSMFYTTKLGPTFTGVTGAYEVPFESRINSDMSGGTFNENHFGNLPSARVLGATFSLVGATAISLDSAAIHTTNIIGDFNIEILGVTASGSTVIAEEQITIEDQSFEIFAVSGASSYDPNNYVGRGIVKFDTGDFPASSITSIDVLRGGTTVWEALPLVNGSVGELGNGGSIGVNILRSDQLFYDISECATGTTIYYDYTAGQCAAINGTYTAATLEPNAEKYQNQYTLEFFDKPTISLYTEYSKDTVAGGSYTYEVNNGIFIYDTKFKLNSNGLDDKCSMGRRVDHNSQEGISDVVFEVNTGYGNGPDIQDSWNLEHYMIARSAWNTYTDDFRSTCGVEFRNDYTNANTGNNGWDVMLPLQSEGIDFNRYLSQNELVYSWAVSQNSSSNIYSEVLFNSFPNIECDPLTSVNIPSGTTGMDCAGNCWGMTGYGATLDDCGVCGYTSDVTWNETCTDCAGEPYGPAYVNDCLQCVCGSTQDAAYTANCLGMDTCVQYCDGQWTSAGYGPTYSNCNVCGGADNIPWAQHSGGTGHTGTTPSNYTDPGIGVLEITSNPNYFFWFAVYDSSYPATGSNLDTYKDSDIDFGATFAFDWQAEEAGVTWWSNLTGTTYGIINSPYGNCKPVWSGDAIGSHDCFGNSPRLYDGSDNPLYGATLDDCGVCNYTGDDEWNSTCADCAGVPNGTSYNDSCLNCVSEPDPTCVQLCDGHYYNEYSGFPSPGPTYDYCGTCGGMGAPDGFGCSCEHDCLGDIPWELRLTYEARHKEPYTAIRINYEYEKDYVYNEIPFVLELQYKIESYSGFTNASVPADCLLDTIKVTTSIEGKDIEISKDDLVVLENSPGSTSDISLIFPTLFNRPYLESTDYIYDDDTVELSRVTLNNYDLFLSNNQSINIKYTKQLPALTNPTLIGEAESVVENLSNLIVDNAEFLATYKENMKEFALLGRTAIARLIKDIFKVSSNNYEGRFDGFLKVLEKNLLANGFHNYHKLLYVDTYEEYRPGEGLAGKTVSFTMATYMKHLFTTNGQLMQNIPLYTLIHSIFCHDFEKNLIDKALTTEVRDVIPSPISHLSYISELKESNIDTSSEVTLAANNKKTSLNHITLDSSYDHKYNVYTTVLNKINTDNNLNIRYIPPYETSTFFTTERDWDSLSFLQHILPIGLVITLLREQEKAIQDDMYEIIKNNIEGNAIDIHKGATGTDGIIPVMQDIESLVAETRGLDTLFTYKPVVSYHTADSYNDIISNNIIATSDEMYNQVEVLYMDEPALTVSPDKMDNKATAMISYDQDFDYLRTYTTYMKNLDPNLFLSWSEANAYLGATALERQYKNQNSSLLDAYTPEPSLIAQNVLMNTLRPMYQGTLTVLGNPNIKPWDIVYVYDDTTGMYGPVEVEQVVNSISVNGGYVTTIVPNLLVYRKNMMKAIDQTLLDNLGKFAVASHVATSMAWVLRTGVIAGSWFKLLRPWVAGHAAVGGTIKEVVTYLGSKAAIGTVDAKAAKILTKKIASKTKSIRSIRNKLLDKTLIPEAKEGMNSTMKRITEQRATLKAEKRTLYKSLATRGSIASWGLRLLNWGFWIYTAYDIVTTAWDMIEVSSTHKVNLANLLAGENFLTMLPLEYKGAAYVAGMEGIIGTPRSFSTMVMGELKGKEGSNRALYILGTLGEQVIKD